MLESLMDNNSIKHFLGKKFRNYLNDNKHIHGIYAYVDDNGNLAFDEFTENPNKTISELKKSLYE